MMQKIPFFKLFAALQPPAEWKAKLVGAEIGNAVIQQKTFSMKLQLTTRMPLEATEVAELERMIAVTYGMSAVSIDAQSAEKTTGRTAAPAAPQRTAEEHGSAAKVLYGNHIKGRPVPMKTLNLKMGTATVAGKVFSADCHETRRPGMWRLSFDMTDYTNSVSVQKNLTAKEAEKVGKAIQPGMWLLVQGRMEPTWDGKDIQLNPYHINLYQHPEREDTAPEKRVELHLHTKMSNMDALTDTGEVVKEAIRWGHPAIAITDHGVAQSFPDAAKASGGKIKILYGMEGYFLNNLDDRIAVHGDFDCDLDEEFVCFDIQKDDPNYPHVQMEPKSELLNRYYTAIGTDASFRQIPIVRELLSMGLYFWLLVLVSLYLIYQKEYAKLLWILPLWMYLCTCLLGPAALLRYGYPLMAACPVVLYAMWKKNA